MTITEHRYLSPSGLHDYCLSQGMYNAGTYEEFNALLTYAATFVGGISLDELHRIARDVYDHTDFPKDFDANQLIANIMNAIVENACRSTFSIEEDSHENTPTTH